MFIQTAAFVGDHAVAERVNMSMEVQAVSELTTIRIAHNGFSGRKLHAAAADRSELFAVKTTLE